MNNSPRIYALKNLSPEVAAVTFAKCSRSAEPFDVIARELSDEKSAEFNEKWVVNYGHGSVAEHAFMNIAIENVSLIAVEAIQANRLASYTEKSSRYQVYTRDRVFVPKALYYDSRLISSYLESINALYDLYEKSIEPIKAAIEKLYPNDKNLSEAAYQASIKSKWIDVVRFALPNTALANLGMSANARTMEYAITKMLSHPLEEVREIGESVKRVALEITPTLVKYADASNYYARNEDFLFKTSLDQLDAVKPSDFNRDNQLSVDLIDYDPNGENKVLAGMLYKFKSISYREALEHVEKMTEADKAEIFKTILGDAKNIYEKPPRELEYPYYTFDVMLDQGAYYDLKRNRIMTQTPQILSADYGYYTPKLFDQVGLGNDYRKAMDQAHETARLISQYHPYEAQYITTKATARRFVMKMNLREAFYFIGLRSRQGGHFTYRKIGQLLHQQILKVHPNLAKYILVDNS
ncbi:MAG: FAD-dependent thymidylate synthase [bacterium]